MDPVRGSPSLGPVVAAYLHHRLAGRGARLDVRPEHRIITRCSRARAAAPRAPRPSSLMETSPRPRRGASGVASVRACTAIWCARERFEASRDAIARSPPARALSRALVRARARAAPRPPPALLRSRERRSGSGCLTRNHTAVFVFRPAQNLRAQLFKYTSLLLARPSQCANCDALVMVIPRGAQNDR